MRRVQRDRHTPLTSDSVEIADFVDERVLRPGDAVVFEGAAGYEKGWINKDGWINDECDELHPTVEVWITVAMKRKGIDFKLRKVDLWSKVRARGHTLAEMRDALVEWKARKGFTASDEEEERKREKSKPDWARVVSVSQAFDSDDARIPELEVVNPDVSEDPSYVPPSHTPPSSVSSVSEMASSSAAASSTLGRMTSEEDLLMTSAERARKKRAQSSGEQSGESEGDDEEYRGSAAHRKPAKKRARPSRPAAKRAASPAGKAAKQEQHAVDDPVVDSEKEEPLKCNRRKRDDSDDAEAKRNEHRDVAMDDAPAVAAAAAAAAAAGDVAPMSVDENPPKAADVPMDDVTLDSVPPTQPSARTLPPTITGSAGASKPSAAAARSTDDSEGGAWVSKKPRPATTPEPKAAEVIVPSSQRASSQPKSPAAADRSPRSPPAKPAVLKMPASARAKEAEKPTSPVSPVRHAAPKTPTKLRDTQQKTSPPMPDEAKRPLSPSRNVVPQEERKPAVLRTPTKPKPAEKAPSPPPTLDETQLSLDGLVETAPSLKSGSADISQLRHRMEEHEEALHKISEAAPVPKPAQPTPAAPAAPVAPAAAAPMGPPMSTPKKAAKPAVQPRSPLAAAGAIPGSAAGVVILPSSLKSQMMVHLLMAVEKMGGSVVDAFSDAVTHVVVDADEHRAVASRTIKYALGVVAGRWVVSFAWVLDSFAAGKWLDETAYEVSRDNHASGAARKGRLRASCSEAALFAGHQFFVAPSVDPQLAASLAQVVALGGGEVLKHAPQAPTCVSEVLGGPAQSVHVLAPPGLTMAEARALYMEAGRRPLSLEWVLDCVSEYRVVPVEQYQIAIVGGDELLALESQHSLAF
eukprot:m51a1_g13104 hypothetical protein (863) ;mRNA; r:18-2755